MREPLTTTFEEHNAAANSAEPQGADRRWLRTLGLCLSLPVALFVALRPERYSLTPNSLDPVFYTGYAINFDDLLNAAGDGHYFVTRWTAYYPVYLLDRVIGPTASRLAWRWVLAGLVVFALTELGRRLGWRRGVIALVSAITLSAPVFLRAFLTDYVEYLVVGLLVPLIVLCLRERQSFLTAGGIGLLAAAVLIANPNAVFAVGLACLVALYLEGGGWLRRLRLVAVSLVAATGVVVFGLILFRLRYNIPNVYEPSIRFMLTYAGDPDAWKSPRLEWLGRFTWIYSHAVLLVVTFGLSLRKRIIWSKVELAALVLCGLQFAVQWLDQFLRDGFGLELSFFWSFSIPSFLVALAVVVAKLAAEARAVALAGILLAWGTVLLIGIPDSLRLPAGWWFGAAAVIVAASVVLVTARRRVLGVGSLVIALLWMQIGAPEYDPSSYFFLNVSPRYDKVIWNEGDTSDLVFEEALWFAEQMDKVPNDASTSFVSAGGWSSSISGLYAPHVTGRLINPEFGVTLAEQTIREIKSGFHPMLAIFGDRRQVEGIYADLARRLDLGEPILDETRARGFGYRLVVFSMPDATRLPFTWSADALPRVEGDVVGSAVEVRPPDVAGVITYGPYLRLETGRYVVTFRYQADAPSDVVVGAGDVAAMDGVQVAAVDFRGSDGEMTEVSVEFESTESAVWEFRTFWDGSAPVQIQSITLAPGG